MYGIKLLLLNCQEDIDCIKMEHTGMVNWYVDGIMPTCSVSLAQSEFSSAFDGTLRGVNTSHDNDVY